VDHKNYKVHRLIAEAFHPNPGFKPEVDHIDRDRSNNFASNLRWATDTEQMGNRFASDATLRAFGLCGRVTTRRRGRQLTGRP